MKTYKVSCEFYIKAENETQAEEIVSDDFCSGDFMEEHIMINESKLPEDDNYWNEEEDLDG